MDNKTTVIFLLRKSISILPALLFLNACTTIAPVPHGEAVLHMLNIDQDGNYVPIGNSEFAPDLGQKLFQIQQQIFTNKGKAASPLRDGVLDDLLENRIGPKIVNSGKKEIVLFIHGGLNTPETTIRRVANLYQKILDSGKYPIFINWRSGPIDTYKAHLARVREGRISSTAPVTAPLYLLTDLAQSIATAPKTWTVQGRHLWKATVGREPPPVKDIVAKDAQVELVGGTVRESGKEIGSMLAWAVTAPAKVITSPFTSTMGRPAWDVMLRRVKTQFRKPSEFRIDQPPHCLEESVYEQFKQLQRQIPDLVVDDECFVGTGTLSVFLNWLEKQQRMHNYKITAIGHSMGAIVLTEALRTNPKLKLQNIVYMAAAVKTRDVIEHLTPYLLENDKTHFYNLSLHPKNEDRERTVYGLLPSGSLLVWIDTMYTTPKTFLDRTFGRWNNIKYVRHVFPDRIRDRMTYKIFGFNTKDRFLPQKHGDFGQCEFWNPMFWKKEIIAKPYAYCSDLR